MTVETENFDTSERESKDTRAQRKAVSAFLQRAAVALNCGLRNAPDRAPANWNNEAFICQRAAVAIDSCTRRAVNHYLFDDAPQKNRIERGRCGHRLCPHCHKVIATRVGLALTEIVTAELQAGSRLAMLTLPILHSRKDRLRESRNALRKANADLIKRQLWNSLVAEFHRVAEVERTRKNGWNPHYHYAIKVRYSRAMAQQLWRDGWLDKPEDELRRCVKESLKEARAWRRAALAELPALREIWKRQGLRTSARLRKSREFRAPIYTQYAKMVEQPQQLNLWLWWCKMRRAKLRAKLSALRRERKECLKATPDRNARRAIKERIKREMDAARETFNARPSTFTVQTHADVEDWLRDEWRVVTRKVKRESYVLSYDAWKPGTQPGTILWTPKKHGRPVGKPFDKSVVKAVQELVKYTTKGHGRGKKKGQVGFFEYSPHEVADYLKGVKNWHLHQSSRGWIAAQHAYEAAMEQVKGAAEKEEGGRRVGFVEMVKDLEDGVGGLLAPDQVEEVIRDGLAILNLHRRERSEDAEFSDEQMRALESHLARLLGDDRSTLHSFKLTLAETRELSRLRGRVGGKGVNLDDLLLAVRERRRELAALQRELLDLPGDLHFTPAGQHLQMRIRRAEQRVKLALEAVREAEARKRDEMRVDAWVNEQREIAQSWGQLEDDYALQVQG